jgi:hypothetical protein
MNKSFIAIFVLTVTACNEISFKEPQPKGKRALSEIPRELRGKYLISEAQGRNTDTLVVTKDQYYVRGDSTRGELGDSLVLKKYGGYYFFNDNENPEWLLRVVKREDNGDLSYMSMENDEKSFNTFLIDLNNEIKIDSIEVAGETLYQIDPSPPQLLSLIKKGYFRKSILLKRLKD